MLARGARGQLPRHVAPGVQALGTRVELGWMWAHTDDLSRDAEALNDAADRRAKMEAAPENAVAGVWLPEVFRYDEAAAAVLVAVDGPLVDVCGALVDILHPRRRCAARTPCGGGGGTPCGAPSPGMRVARVW
jgi:hypothetical protein